jgi:four helix bundle protein
MSAEQQFRGYFSYERLDVYRVARELSDLILPTAARLPAEEVDLRRQWLRACNGLCSNIAEAGQETRSAEKARIYRIARREAGEVNSCNADVFARGYLSADDYSALSSRTNRVSAMLWGLIKRFTGKP